MDFEIFDKASRGAWGSLLLLFRTRGKSLAAFGALLTVLLLAIDTFFQQVTELPERWTLQGQSSIPRVIQYEPEHTREYLNGDEAAQTNQDIMNIADAFFTGNGTHPVSVGNGSRPDIPLSCPASKCTWPTYNSIGMCSRCVEVPDLLTYACVDTRVDWTSKLNATVSSYQNATVCGYFLNKTSEDRILMSGYILSAEGTADGEALLMRTLPLVTNPLRKSLWGGSLNFKDVRNPIVDALISSSVNLSEVYANVAPTLHECVLTWCVKTIESAYYAGTYQENITNVIINNTSNGSQWSTFTYDDGSTDQTYLENITINVPITGTPTPKLDWGVSNLTMVNTVFVFDRLFPSFTTMVNNHTEPLLRWRLGSPTQVRTRELDFNPWLAPNNVSLHMERMATAITNVIRSTSNSERVVGQAYNLETYVIVHWAWLAFPLVMLAFSLVFLVATIIETSKGPNEDIEIHKNSAMPSLIYSLPEGMRHNVAASSTWPSTSSNGLKRVKIRLMPDKGWRTSAQLHSYPDPFRGASPERL